MTGGEWDERARQPWARAGRGLARLADLVLPPRCLRCGAVIEASGGLCPDCWPGMRFVAPPFCAACGLPFDLPAEAGMLCAGCIRKPFRFRRARAVLVYDDASRDLLIGFKHRDRTDAAPAFGRWLLRAGSDLLVDADLLVPVPLHWTRLFARRFNQAALLALEIGAASGIAVDVRGLVRRRRTVSLGHLSPVHRRRVVRGVFAVPAVARPGLAGRRVVLVDDVFTTGATAEAAAGVLLRAGAASVDLLTLARVVRPLV